MSYHGSVSCSFCGQLGHNRRTCQYLKQQIEEWQSSDDPLVRKRATLLQHTSNRPRKCSFCKQPGHTVRKCPEMTAHVQEVADSWFEAKRFVKKKMFEQQHTPPKGGWRPTTPPPLNRNVSDESDDDDLGPPPPIDFNRMSLHRYVRRSVCRKIKF